MKVKFLTDYKPYKKDQVVDVNERAVQYYLQNGIVKEDCGCDDNKAEPCLGCGEKVVVVEEKGFETKKKVKKNK